MNDLMSISVESLLYERKHSTLWGNFLLSGSIILVVLKLIWALLVTVPTSKYTNPIFYIHSGITPKRIRTLLYYTHFLLFRLFYASFIMSSRHIPKKIVFCLILGLQVTSMGALALIRPFDGKVLSLQVLIGRDLNFLSSIVIYIVAIMRESGAEGLGTLQIWVNMGYCIIFVGICFGQFLYSLKRC